VLYHPVEVRRVGLNYVDHAKKTGSPIPEFPIVFYKAETSISGANDNAR